MAKKIIFIFTLLIFIKSSYIFSQQSVIDAELIIVNYAHPINPNVYVRISPVNSIYSGDIENIPYNTYGKYEFRAFIHPSNIEYIYGGISNNWHIDAYGYRIIYINHDKTTYSPSNPIRMAICYGKYKIEFGDFDEFGNFIPLQDAFCYIDFSDGNYPYQYPSTFTNDIFINLRVTTDSYSYYIDFMFSGGSLMQLSDIPEQDRTIKIWHQLGLNNNQYRIPSKGTFYTEINGNNYIFPLIAPNEIDGKQFIHTNPEIINVNFNITQAHTTFLNTNKNLTLLPNTLLNLKSNPNTKFTLLQSSNLVLKRAVTATVENYANLTLLSNSTLSVTQDAEVRIQPYGKLCNYGGRISNSGRIVFEGGRDRCPDWQDFLVSDSTQIVLEDNASWELEAGSTITLEGKTTCLRMSPGSSIKFGENSKLIIKDGANIVADNATFTSLNPGETWDGIYLEDVSNDTIRFCTIENAVNGINVIDKTPLLPADKPSTEISNCTFINTTFNPMTNGIFISNSSNILIRNNNFTSSQDNGFTAGIISQYCPSGNFNIIDNTIDKTQTGITVIQSSPYIARNTITGQAGEGNGIYLDNANGTLEYNTINSFNRSVVSYYS